MQVLVRLGLLTEQELESAIATEFNPVRVGESWLIVPTCLLSVLVSHSSSSNATPRQHAAALTFVKTQLPQARAAMAAVQRGKGSFSEADGWDEHLPQSPQGLHAAQGGK